MIAEKTMLNNPDGQLIQGLFMRIALPEYFRAVREMCKSRLNIAKIDECARRLKATVQVNKNLKYCYKSDAVPIEELTVGELLLAAENCLTFKCETINGLRIASNGNIESVGREIIEDMLIIPLACVDSAQLGRDDVPPPSEKGGDEQIKT